MTDFAWRTFTNKTGKVYDPAASTRPYAQDLNLLKDALQTGQAKILLCLLNVTTTQRNAIPNPLAGMKVWNTDTGQEEVYNGSSWVAPTGGGATRYRYLGSSFSGGEGPGRSLVLAFSLGAGHHVVLGGKTLDPASEYSLSTTVLTDDTLTITPWLSNDDVVLLWN